MKVINNIDLSGLSHSQIEKVKEVLREEANVFSQDDQYVGDVLEPQMKIKLKDDIPVQHNCKTSPRRLGSKMKQYIKDLLNNIAQNIKFSIKYFFGKGD